MKEPTSHGLEEIPMIKGLICTFAFLSAAAVSNPRESHQTRNLQTFDTMYGVDGPFVGDGFPIRGIAGDELPWEVKDAPEVPIELRGTNDEAEFRGAVSCWTEEGDHVATVNVITRGFPATASGDSSIRATLNLPNPCVAPIIMVLAGSEDKWFTVTGFESEEE